MESRKGKYTLLYACVHTNALGWDFTSFSCVFSFLCNVSRNAAIVWAPGVVRSYSPNGPPLAYPSDND